MGGLIQGFSKYWIWWSLTLLGVLVLASPWLVQGLASLATSPNLIQRLTPPLQGSFLLGTDQHGVSIAAVLLYGAHLSLGIGILATAINLTIGIFLGLMSGWFSGLIDSIFFRVSEILQAFPGTLLLIALAAILPAGFGTLLLALTLTGWIGYLRTTRAMVLQIKEREFIEAQRALGNSLPNIILRHLLPNVLPILAVQAAFGLAGTILAESTLAFLGLGLPPGTPSWGALLAQGKDYLFEAPWIAILPGICLAMTLWVINWLGDRLRDHFDPRSQQRL